MSKYESIIHSFSLYSVRVFFFCFHLLFWTWLTRFFSLICFVLMISSHTIFRIKANLTFIQLLSSFVFTGISKPARTWSPNSSFKKPLKLDTRYTSWTMSIQLPKALSFGSVRAASAQEYQAWSISVYTFSCSSEQVSLQPLSFWLLSLHQSPSSSSPAVHSAYRPVNFKQ